MKSYVIRNPSLVALCASFCALAPEVRAQCAAQGIALARGWNAVYVEVSPEASPDALFANWPVDSVGVYDPAAFLATRQFSRLRGDAGPPPRRPPHRHGPPLPEARLPARGNRARVAWAAS